MWRFGKFRSSSLKKSFPIFVEMLLLDSELNNIVILFCLLCFCYLASVGLYLVSHYNLIATNSLHIILLIVGIVTGTF